MGKCKICGTETKTVFNIDFKAVPICENCSNSIFLQQATWFVTKLNPLLKLKCPICNGSGEVQQSDTDWDTCRKCDGTGLYLITYST